MITKSLIIALIYTESSFNPVAISTENAKGLAQITEIAVKEVHNQTGWSNAPDLFDPETNIEYAIRLLEHYQKESINVKELLATYNGGYRQLRALRAGQPLATETALYIPAVLRRANILSGYFRLCDTRVGLPYEDIIDAYFERQRRAPFARSAGDYFARQPSGHYIPYQQGRPGVNPKRAEYCTNLKRQFRSSGHRAAHPFGS